MVVRKAWPNGPGLDIPEQPRPRVALHRGRSPRSASETWPIGWGSPRGPSSGSWPTSRGEDISRARARGVGITTRCTRTARCGIPWSRTARWARCWTSSCGPAHPIRGARRPDRPPPRPLGGPRISGRIGRPSEMTGRTPITLPGAWLSAACSRRRRVAIARVAIRPSSLRFPGGQPRREKGVAAPSIVRWADRPVTAPSVVGLGEAAGGAMPAATATAGSLGSASGRRGRACPRGHRRGEDRRLLDGGFLGEGRGRRGAFLDLGRGRDWSIGGMMILAPTPRRSGSGTTCLLAAQRALAYRSEL